VPGHIGLLWISLGVAIVTDHAHKITQSFATLAIALLLGSASIVPPVENREGALFVTVRSSRCG